MNLHRADGREPPYAGSLVAVVLAAGQGTRMRSGRHKVLHPLAGKPLIQRVLDLLEGVGAQRTIVVLGHQADQVRALLPTTVDTVIQEQQRGTGHALQTAAPRVRELGADSVLVHFGDEPLVRPASLTRLIQRGVSEVAPVALLNARVRDPFGYGRVLRLKDGTVDAMVEEVDATPEQRTIDEIWSGTMLLWAPWLWDNLDRLPLSPKGEYYLPSLVAIARTQGLSVLAALPADEEEVLGVNSQAQLAQAEAILRRRTLEALMENGVTVIDPAGTYVEPEVRVARDTILHPGTHLRGRTQIGGRCEIGPNAYVIDTQVGSGCRILYSVLEGARVGDDVSIGPFSHLRPGATIEDGVTLGNYAEVKNSRIGAGTQMHHFSYMGDAEVGRNVNIGAGTISVNFNSETGLKSRTVIDDDASIGSDTMLVAPVHIGEGAITAAGSVVTHDIPDREVWVGAPARAFRKRRDRKRADRPPGPGAQP
ncbi:MAG: bifunctional UDP-N-acetylglucosamine diphosphorylase/glucosamine-1-phosphate N-acetyltransferase GlmU [Chloroflexota bacterium]